MVAWTSCAAIGEAIGDEGGKAVAAAVKGDSERLIAWHLLLTET